MPHETPNSIQVLARHIKLLVNSWQCFGLKSVEKHVFIVFSKNLHVGCNSTINMQNSDTKVGQFHL